MTDKILSQILAIRNFGVVNMFDYRTVQKIAYDHDMFELVIYIEENPSQYCYFILHGKEPSNE